MQIFLLIQLFILLLQPHPEILKPGERFPSCIFSTSDGNALYTDSLIGNIMVIDFWASWNSPSRKHNLQLIKLYEKLRVQNYRRKHKVLFLSVSMDTQFDLWLVARAKDDLHWPYNICDFKGWDSEITDRLGLRIIPANFIVDQKGIIVAKNLWGMGLDSTLREMNKQMPN
jgi:thiol-disulfide isomerase/thioredoxin